MSKKDKKKLITAIITIVLIIGIFLTQRYLRINRENGTGVEIFNPDAESVRVHIIDVGQADAIFIELPGHRAMVIDGGNNDDGDDVVSYIRQLGYHKIDYLIGTHPHEDHIGGLDDVIKAFDLGEIYLPRLEYTTKTYADVLQAIADKGKQVTAAKTGVKIIDEDALVIEILSPARTEYKELNSYSAVIRMIYGDNIFLFMGDATVSNETDIFNAGYNVKADFLKVGHHGSKTSSSEEFLAEVSPEYAVISVGKDNSYGLPDDEVLARLDQYADHLYRTDQSGTIVVTGNGKRIAVQEEK